MSSCESDGRKICSDRNRNRNISRWEVSTHLLSHISDKWTLVSLTVKNKMGKIDFSFHTESIYKPILLFVFIMPGLKHAPYRVQYCPWTMVLTVVGRPLFRVGGVLCECWASDSIYYHCLSNLWQFSISKHMHIYIACVCVCVLHLLTIAIADSGARAIWNIRVLENHQ